MGAEIHHAGAIFIGPMFLESSATTVPAPNHVLPTSTSARFSSPLGVHDFQKRSSLIRVSLAGAQTLGKIASTLAHGEACRRTQNRPSSDWIDADTGTTAPPAVTLWRFFRLLEDRSARVSGGVLPFARHYLVETSRWMTAEEFNQQLGLCQFLPGPNVVNLAVVVGRRYGGLAGACLAPFGLPRRAGGDRAAAGRALRRVRCLAAGAGDAARHRRRRAPACSSRWPSAWCWRSSANRSSCCPAGSSSPPSRCCVALPAVMLAGIVLSGAVAYGLLRKGRSMSLLSRAVLPNSHCSPSSPSAARRHCCPSYIASSSSSNTGWMRRPSRTYARLRRRHLGPNVLVVTLIGWQVAGLAGALVAHAGDVPADEAWVHLLFGHSGPLQGRALAACRSIGVAPLAVGLIFWGDAGRTSRPGWAGRVGLRWPWRSSSARTKFHPLWCIAAGAVLGLAGLV